MSSDLLKECQTNVKSHHEKEYELALDRCVDEIKKVSAQGLWYVRIRFELKHIDLVNMIIEYFKVKGFKCSAEYTKLIMVPFVPPSQLIIISW